MYSVCIELERNRTFIIYSTSKYINHYMTSLSLFLNSLNLPSRLDKRVIKENLLGNPDFKLTTYIYIYNYTLSYR